ncbi:polyphosphate--glucose phosphotransferase [Ereboglobus luteus]|uniref:Polyphosphate glucokinase n=1 Tax=Ereboglobus luteus TaxID=1796921 RepID=A0A2U8DZK0_9BACT|nr:ROK family protein [Ereboglobus luteus]AWI07965.1 polyphosphate glucokinase [Ereboglobus luteus]
MNVLSIDIGGSAVKGAPVDTRTGKLLAERYRIETPDKVSPQRLGEIIAEIAKHFRWRGRIGAGFPGVAQGPMIRTSANLHKKFIDCDLVEVIEKATKCRVRVINDADAAGVAEMRFGAGRGEKGAVLLLTLGTGIGSALFWRGVLQPNTELGHLPIRGKSAEKFVAASARKQRDLSWKEWGTQLGNYVRVLEKLLWPELIIVGGGVSDKHHKFFKYMKTRARLVPAEFFNDAGIVGAALAGTGKI